MGRYREIAPSPHLESLVECFWTSQEGADSGVVQRVSPDGCADIIWSRDDCSTDLRFVGPMTRYVDHPQPAGLRLLGVRFRPAQWAAWLRVHAADVTDRVLPLSEVRGSLPARELAVRLAGHETARQGVEILEKWLSRALPRPGAFEAAIAALERSHGALPLNQAAGMAGLSLRQFRRRCLETTGFPPKLLARILRFRRVAALLTPGMSGRGAELAAACGYADQSHLIAEFRCFAGRTPALAFRVHGPSPEMTVSG